MTRSIVKSRKHWSTYVVPAVMLAFGTLFLFAWLTATNSTTLLFVLGFPLAVAGLYKILQYRTVIWELHESYLTITSGILLKSNAHLPIHSIFEGYYTFNLDGKLLGYGNLHIKRNDGVGSIISSDRMANHHSMIGAINARINDLKSPGRGDVTQSTPVSSTADEILKLKGLLDAGILSRDEFDREKARILYP